MSDGACIDWILDFSSSDRFLTRDTLDCSEDSGDGVELALKTEEKPFEKTIEVGWAMLIVLYVWMHDSFIKTDDKNY